MPIKKHKSVKRRNPESKKQLEISNLIRAINLDLDFIKFDLPSFSSDELEYIERKLSVVKSILNSME